ncbi:MAG: AfsR/SARP family transcriptional regulator [Aggregatilineales bacterium]
MSLHTAIEQAFETFQREAQRANVILLHPHSRYRSLLLARLLSDDTSDAYYYAMRPDDTSLPAFINGLIREMSGQHPSFGRHLNMLDQGIYDDYKKNMKEILTAFIAELEEISSSPFIFILDEYDRSDNADDLHRFIQQLTGHLPPQCRLVLNSRTLPRLPWVAMIARNQAILLQDDMLIEKDFYNTYQDDNYNMQVYGLGSSSVYYQENQITNWEGHLPRLLFFFALDRPIVTRAEICHAFWPELGSDQAVNVFHVTKRRLHKAVGMDILIHDTSYYQVSPTFNIRYDVMDFVELLMQGRNPQRSSEDRLALWEQAEKLYQGPFLHGHRDAWILDRRAAFHEGYLETLISIANIHQENNKGDVALQYFQKALDDNYQRQDIHQSVMQLYADMGRRPEAIKHYQNLEKTFNDKGIMIEPHTQQLYTDISAG